MDQVVDAGQDTGKNTVYGVKLNASGRCSVSVYRAVEPTEPAEPVETLPPGRRGADKGDFPDGF